MKTAVYFLLIFSVLALLFLPTFFNPPHVDYWEAFFTFHQVRADPDLGVWPYVVNHDPWRDGTFRPLSYTLLYLEHLAFGSRFIFNHLLNFAVYCLVLVLLFRFGLRLGARRYEMGAFTAVFAFLYSHCDILSLTFHIFILAPLAGFLAAFIYYLYFLQRGNCLIMFAVGLLMFVSMLCYEIFALWPPALLILLVGFAPPGSFRKRLLPTLITLAVIYFFYFGVFYMTRTACYLSGDLASPGIGRTPAGAVFALFNLLYNQVGVNIWPPMAFPGRYRGYSEMLGIFPLRDPSWFPLLIYSLAAVSVLLLVLLFRAVIRRSSKKTVAAAAFLLWLYLGNFSLLAAARSTTSDWSHILRQFRYQFVPNALVILLAAVIISAFLRPSRNHRKALTAVLTVIFLLNVYYTHRHVEIVSERLAPLRALLTEIRTGMEKGDITPSRPLYLPDGFARSFPRLCWNRGMGKRIWGSFQWIFSPEELKSFRRRPEAAHWTIDFTDGRYRKR